jgi:hypothetical protein
MTAAAAASPDDEASRPGEMYCMSRRAVAATGGDVEDDGASGWYAQYVESERRVTGGNRVSAGDGVGCVYVVPFESTDRQSTNTVHCLPVPEVMYCRQFHSPAGHMQQTEESD